MKECNGHRARNAKRAIVVIVAVAMLVFVGYATVFASGGEDVEHGAAPKGWVKTDWYRVMNFAVLAIALFLVLRKPAAQALNNRIKGIASELQDLEIRKSAVEKQLAEYNNKIATLDKEAETIVAEYIRQGEEAKNRILKEAQASAEKLRDQAKKNIDYEFEQAKLSLQKTITEKALIKAERIIKEKISASDQDRLVDEYLDKVVA